MGLENGGEGVGLSECWPSLLLLAYFYKNKVKKPFCRKKKWLANEKKNTVFLLFEVENYNNQKTIFLPEIFKLIIN